MNNSVITLMTDEDEALIYVTDEKGTHHLYDTHGREVKHGECIDEMDFNNPETIVDEGSSGYHTHRCENITIFSFVALIIVCEFLLIWCICFRDKTRSVVSFLTKHILGFLLKMRPNFLKHNIVEKTWTPNPNLDAEVDNVIKAYELARKNKVFKVPESWNETKNEQVNVPITHSDTTIFQPSSYNENISVRITIN